MRRNENNILPRAFCPICTLRSSKPLHYALDYSFRLSNNELLERDFPKESVSSNFFYFHLYLAYLFLDLNATETACVGQGPFQFSVTRLLPFDPFFTDLCLVARC